MQGNLEQRFAQERTKSVSFGVLALFFGRDGFQVALEKIGERDCFQLFGPYREAMLIHSDLHVANPGLGVGFEGEGFANGCEAGSANLSLPFVAPFSDCCHRQVLLAVTHV